MSTRGRRGRRIKIGDRSAKKWLTGEDREMENKAAVSKWVTFVVG
jgi:hypothetical protein